MSLPSSRSCKNRLHGGTEVEQPNLTGLHDHALVGVMVYTFARVNAVLQMKVRDYFRAGTPRVGPAARKKWQRA